MARLALAAPLVFVVASLVGACTPRPPAELPDTDAQAQGAEPARAQGEVFVESQPNALRGDAAPPDPQVASLFRCWFHDPYPYMFDDRHGTLELDNGRRYGMFMAGISGLLYYGDLNECAGELVGQKPKSYSDITPIEAFAGVPATLDGGGQLNFDTVNPEFVTWARRTLLVSPGASIDGIPAKLAYDQVFSRFFRLMGEGALVLYDRYAIDAESSLYLGDTKRGADGIDWLEQRYAGELSHHGGGWDGTTMTPPMAMGFWLRRHLDGSEASCWHGVREVLARYDGPWLAEQKAKYPQGWAALASYRDPLEQP